MSIQSLADHELRSLVRFGSPKFAEQAQAELDRRAKVVKAKEDGGLKMEDGEPAAAFPSGRWS